MTVLTTASREVKAGNGVTTSFAFTVVFGDTSEILVVHQAAAGAQTVWSLGTQYELTGAGNPQGGTLTTNSGYTVASGDSLIIRRLLSLTQEVDLVPNSALPADTLEGALDKLTRLLQDRALVDSRCLRMDDNDPSATLAALPYKSVLANKYLVFDGSGNPTVASSLSGPTDVFNQDLTGAVDRTYLDKNRDVVSVADFGGSPDGTGAENHTAFQAALDSGAAWIYIPQGEYDLDGTLVVPSGVSLVGCGAGTLLIHGTDTVNMFEVGDAATGAERNMFLNFDVWADHTKTAGAVFRGRRVDQCIWDGVRLGTLNRLADDGNLLYDGFELQGCFRCTISETCNVIAQNIGIAVAGQYIAAAQTWGAELNVFCRLLFCGTGVRCGGAFGGLYVRGEISRCVVGLDLTDQYAFDENYATVTGQANREIFIFEEAIIDSCDDYAVVIRANGAAIVEILGAWLTSTGAFDAGAQGVGLYVAPSANAVVRLRGVLFYNNNVAAANFSSGFNDMRGCSVRLCETGVTVNAGASGSVIDGNTFTENATTALVLGGGVTAVHVHGNYFSTNGVNVSTAVSFGGAIDFKNNAGVATSAYGAATGTTDGSGDLTVTHGLVATPSNVLVTNAVSSAAYGIYVHAVGATTFKIRFFTISATPAAGAGISGAAYWRAEV